MPRGRKKAPLKAKLKQLPRGEISYAQALELRRSMKTPTARAYIFANIEEVILDKELNGNTWQEAAEVLWIMGRVDEQVSGATLRVYVCQALKACGTTYEEICEAADITPSERPVLVRKGAREEVVDAISLSQDQPPVPADPKPNRPSLKAMPRPGTVDEAEAVISNLLDGTAPGRSRATRQQSMVGREIEEFVEEITAPRPQTAQRQLESVAS